MTAFADTLAQTPPASTSAASGFGHRLAPPGDPLEGAGFDQLYTARIEPELVKREAERKSALRTFFIALAGGLVAIFLENMMASAFTGGRSHSAAPTLMIFTMIAAGVLGYLPLAAVAQRAKWRSCCAGRSASATGPMDPIRRHSRPTTRSTCCPGPPTSPSRISSPAAATPPTSPSARRT